MNITQAQIDAVKRYAVTAVSTIAGVAGVSAFLQGKGIDVQQVLNAINGLGALATALLGLAGTIGAIVAGLRGFNAASPVNQVQSLKETMASTSTSTETKQAMLAGAVDTVAVAAKEAEPPVQFAAKVALLDTTASLNEVVGTISVTDKNLALNTDSRQVQPA